MSLSRFNFVFCFFFVVNDLDKRKNIKNIKIRVLDLPFYHLANQTTLQSNRPFNLVKYLNDA